MAITFTTKALDNLVPKQLSVAGTALDTAPVDGAGRSVGDMIAAYLQELDAKDARQNRESNVWIARAIQYLKDRVASAERSVGPIDQNEPFDADAVVEIETLLNRPNPQLTNDSFGGLWGQAIEDLLTINRGCILKLPWEQPASQGYADNQPAALRAVDGAKVTVVPGWRSDADGPRYKVARARGQDPLPLMNNQLILMDASPTTYSDKGISPMRVLRRFLQAELATFKRMHLVQVQSTPGGVFMLPNANAGTPDALAEEYEANIQGNAGVVFMNIPADSRYQEIGTVDMERQGSFQFYEILVRGHATAFGVPPMVLGWYADVNKAYGEVAQDMSQEGVTNLLRLVQFYINTEIVAEWGDRAANIHVTFDQLQVEEESEAADSLRTKAGNKDFVLVSELRVAGGYEPFDDQDVPAGVMPFLKELWVPTPVGRGVIDLPWTYWFKCMGIDPDTMEFLPGSPFNPMTATTIAPGEPAPISADTTQLLPGELQAEQAQNVQKRLELVRKALETDPDPTTALEELEGINDIFRQNFRDYVPADAEDSDGEA